MLLALEPLALFGQCAGDASFGIGLLIAFLFQADHQGIAVGHGTEGVGKHLLRCMVILDVALKQVSLPVIAFETACGAREQDGLIGNADAAYQIAVGHEVGKKTGRVIGFPCVNNFPFHVDQIGFIAEVGAEQIVTVTSQFPVVTVHPGGNAVRGHVALL